MSPEAELYQVLEAARQRLLTHRETWHGAETRALQTEVEQLLFEREERLLDQLQPGPVVLHEVAP